MKCCSGCKIEKPLDEFDRDRQRKDGRQNYCRECRRAHNLARPRPYTYWGERHEPSVYFVRYGDSGPVKIGHTINITSRLSTMASAYWEPLTVLAVVPGSRRDEHKLHNRFDADRIKGEWFHPTSELMAYIDTLEST